MAELTATERELAEMLKKLDDDRTRLEARAQAAHEALEENNRRRQSVLDVLDMYREARGIQAAPLAIDEGLRERLMGKTIKQMIVEVARERDPPIFKVTDMNRRLVQAGMFKDEAAARAGVYSVLGRDSKTFRKLDRGRYLVATEMFAGEGTV